MSLCRNTKIHPTHARRAEQGCDKTWNSAPFVCGKTWLWFKKAIGRKLFSGISTSWRLLVCGQLLLSSHDAVPVVCEQHALQPLALAAASVCVFLAIAHSRVSTESLFCLVFSKKFNIISALFVHQSLTLPQKIDSREGLFWCKKGWHATVDKMYFYLRRPPFAPLSGLFTAKFGAFWCKIACVLMLNALRFAAKCSAFWCKTQGKMLLNAVLFAAKCEAKSINIHNNCLNKTF